MINGRNITVYNAGNIVLIPFPFSDLSVYKTRPAVVVSNAQYAISMNVIIVLMITSVQHSTLYDHEIKDWQSTKLLNPSWVRPKPIALSPELVRYQIGSLTPFDLKHVYVKLFLALGYKLKSPPEISS
jgi:mRNA interferase MazF